MDEKEYIDAIKSAEMQKRKFQAAIAKHERISKSIALAVDLSIAMQKNNSMILLNGIYSDRTINI